MPTVTSNRHITEGVIWKQILLFFFPTLLGSFFQQLYNTVDAIIVGRALGTEALASVGASSPILNLVNGFFLGIASGATVILSQAYGAGDRDLADLRCVGCLGHHLCWAEFRCSKV